MKFGLFALFFGLIIVALSCEKDPNPKHFTGIYRGVFNRIANGTDTTGTGVVFLVINTEDFSFKLNGDSITSTPASSSGTYTLPESGKISFTNTAFIAVPVFDRFYVLDTTYSYEFNDPTLNVHLGVDTMFYSYDLIRY